MIWISASYVRIRPLNLARIYGKPTAGLTESWHDLVGLENPVMSGIARTHSVRQKKVASASFWRCAGLIRIFHLTTQPGPGVDPISIGCSGGNAKDLCRLIATQTREVTKFNQASLDRMRLGKLRKRGI